ncbi:uncharacterized protein LOC121402113 [Xenopus laevis]|uniref:Uncharacterized protein LOC121402113 n=1 Tax=Xenopus laevis TaxID=8355 RepID=A0A8J1MRG6_XENLA|nr:uncharacterized protein LOC121402113 [Xenopus laevis]
MVAGTRSDSNRLLGGPQQGQVTASGTAVGGEIAVDQSGMALPPLLSFQVPGATSSGCQFRTDPVQEGGMNRSHVPVGQISQAGARSGHPRDPLPGSGLENRVRGNVRCIIWMVGHSFISRAQERSKVRPNGQQLGFLEEQATVRWLGVGGLCWEEVVPMIIQEARRVGPPNIILVHAGGNDLARCPMKQLTKNIKRDFVRLWSIFPGVCLLWSEILPRKKWRGARSHGAVDSARIKINKAVSKFVQGQGGVAIRHREFDNPSEYCCADGVHLNELGMDLFNFNLWDSLGFAWRVWRGMQH